MDLLGYPVSNTSSTTTQAIYNTLKGIGTPPKFSPFRLMAYQRIFSEYYRNSDYDTLDAYSFNADNVSAAQISDAYVGKFFTPRYAQWMKDRFTSVKPSPLFNFSTATSSLIPNVNNEGIGTGGFGMNYVNRSSDKTQLINYTPSGALPNANLNLQELRATMAYDRLSRLSMLAPKTYKEQIKAHFGVEPDNCDYCSTRYLGFYESNVNIGEVTATSSGSDGSSTNVLGEIAGKGISSGSLNRPIQAHFNEPAIVTGKQIGRAHV